MAETLKIDIDVQAARKSLEGLMGSFNSFKQAANNATSGASAAIQKLNAAISKIKEVNPAVLSGLQTINTTLSQLNTGTLTQLSGALSAFSSSAGGVQATADAIAQAQKSLENLKTPEGISNLSVRFGNAAQGAKRLTDEQKALAAQQRNTASAVKTLGDELLNAGGFMAGIGVTAGKIASALTTLSQNGVTAAQAFEKLKETLGGFGASAAVFTGLVIALKGLYSAATSILSPILQVGNSLNSFKLTIDAIDGSGAGAKTLDSLRGVANRTAQDVTVLTNNFKGFRAATEAAGIESDKSLKIYEQFSTAFGALGLDSQKTEKAFLALTQMFSKGKVQAEELRGQLGDALPGAFVYSAQAMGVTTAALDGLLKAGAVTADELIPKLGKFLELKFGDAIKAQAGSAAGQLTIFNNQINALVASIATGNLGGVLGGVAAGLQRLNEALDSEGLRVFAGVLGDLIGFMTNVVLSTLGSVLDGFTMFFDAVAYGVDVFLQFATPIRDAITWLKEHNAVMDATSRIIGLVGNALGLAIAAWFTFGGAIKVASAAFAILSTAFGGTFKVLTAFIPGLGSATTAMGLFSTALKGTATAQAATTGAAVAMEARLARQGGLWNTLKSGAQSFGNVLKSGFNATLAGAGTALELVVKGGTALVGVLARIATALTLPGLGLLIAGLWLLREPIGALITKAGEWVKSFFEVQKVNEKTATMAETLGTAFKALEEKAAKSPSKILDIALAFDTFDAAAAKSKDQISELKEKLEENKEAYRGNAEAIDEANAPIEAQIAALEKYGVSLDDTSAKMADQLNKYGLSTEEAAKLAFGIQKLHETEQQRADALQEQVDKDQESLDYFAKLTEETQKQVDADKALLASGKGVKEEIQARIAEGQKYIDRLQGMAAKIGTVLAAERALQIARTEGIGLQQALGKAVDELKDKYGLAVDKARVFEEVQKKIAPSMEAQKDATKETADNQQKLSEETGKTAKALESSQSSLDSTKTTVEALSGALSNSQTAFDAANTSLTGISEAAAGLKLSVEALVAQFPILTQSATDFNTAIAPMGESLVPLIEALDHIAVSFTTINTAMPTINEGLTQMSATFAAMTPLVQQVSDAFNTLTVIPSSLEAAKTALEQFMEVMNGAIVDVQTMQEEMRKLADSGDAVREGFEIASGGGDAFIEKLDEVYRAVDSLITKMGELKAAAEAALRAAEQAQQQSGGGGGGEGQRYGGYSEENVYKSSALVGSELLKTAPKFAEGTANTSSHVSRMAGGGIPAILHPNEAVVPLPKGRKIPVDLNLKLSEPPVTSAPAAAANIDSLSVQMMSRGMDSISRSLDSVASAIGKIAPELSRSTSMSAANMEQATEVIGARLENSVSSMSERAKQNDNTFTNASRVAKSPDGLAPPSSLSNVPDQNQRVAPVSQAPASNIVINLNVKTDDVEGFRRSQDQIARQLSDKIRRANRRNG